MEKGQLFIEGMIKKTQTRAVAKCRKISVKHAGTYSYQQALKD
jgi:hypothetical protein